MKKVWKKLLAITLAVSMTMSMVSLSAFAEGEENGEENTAPVAQTPYCGKGEHTHNEECYGLICDKEEGEGAAEGHEHTEECGYEEGNYACGKEEGEGAVAGHVHTEECGYEEGNYACGQEEGEGAVEGHVHTEECGYEEGNYACGQEEGEGAVAGHVHTDDCEGLTCEVEEHTHTNACHMKWDEETATLTITGVDTLTKADVSAYKANAVKVVITGVGAIENEAFRGFPMLESVELTSVGEVGCRDDAILANTFSECPHLLSVTLTDVDYVAREAFRGCRQLNSLTMNNVGEFGTSAFSYCIALPSLDIDGERDGISALGPTMFYGCIGLESVTLKNLDSIGTQAFYGYDVVTKENSVLKAVTLENIGTVGDQAFISCIALETVTMDNISTMGIYLLQGCTSAKTLTVKNSNIGVQSFSGASIETVTMENIGTIGSNAFASCKNLTTVEMGTVNTIEQYAFYNCANLTTIDSLSNVRTSIGGFAFLGCSSLTGLTVADAAKMGFIGSNEEIMGRVQEILAGKFQLDSAAEIRELELESWTAGAIDQSENWSTYDNGTQLMEQAQWANESNGVAEVKVDAYYTGKKQVDYIFVADLSASMAQLGNPEDSNARFYDMQSKLLDMTDKLLGTPGYDCQVAIVTFGGYLSDTATGTANAKGFTENKDEVQAYIKELEPLYENTDYALGLNKVLEVLGTRESDRNTVVVFLSDGRPTYDGTTKLGTVAALSSNDTKIAGIAQKIKDAGVQGIYGVLHSPGNDGNLKFAQNAMNAVCDEYYASTDTESFGSAMNAAFAATYGDNTVTIPVNAEQFNVSGLSASAGIVSYSNGEITWKLEGMPFTQHTLTYDLTLKGALNLPGEYRYSINGGKDATFGEGKASVGLDLELERTVIAVARNEQTGVEYSTLQAAIEAAQNGQTVELLKDAEIVTVKGSQTAKYVSIQGKTITVDLNGHTAFGGYLWVYGNNAGLTVKDSSEEQTGKIDGTTNKYGVRMSGGNGTVTVEGGTVSGVMYAISAESGTVNVTGGEVSGRCGIYAKNAGTKVDINGGTVTATGNQPKSALWLDPSTEATISGNAQLLAPTSYGVSLWGPGGDDENVPHTKLTVDGGNISGYYSAITGNGSVGTGEDWRHTEIVINGGEIVSIGASAIYHPQVGNLTINGGKLTGMTGIEMRAGTLNIPADSTAEITGNYTFNDTYYGYSHSANGSGGTTFGAGIVLSQHTTERPIIATIAGGTVSGYHAVVEHDLQNADPSSAGVELSITGGVFIAVDKGNAVEDPYRTALAYGAATAVVSENLTQFITGGTFSNDVDADETLNYVAEGYESHEIESGYDYAGYFNVHVPVENRADCVECTTSTGSGPSYYQLTINYIDEEGNALAEPYSVRRVEGSYSIASPVIEGYTTEQTVVSGILTEPTTINVVYTAVAEDVEETEPPLSEEPEPTETAEPEPTETAEPEPTETAEEPTEDLGENDTPLAETPTEEPTEEPGEEALGENDTPLADVPQTGDHLALWLALSMMSALGLAWISLTEKKGKRAA